MTKARQIRIEIDRLRNLFPEAEWRGVPPPVLAGVSDDSREAAEGVAFVAIVGFQTDGHLYLGQARQAGAALLVVERGHVAEHPELLEPVRDAPVMLVSNTRRAVAVLADESYGHPSRDMRVHGVTGTKGKTTIVHLVAGILKAAGRRPATMGTLGVEFGDERRTSALTTPGPIEVQRQMRLMADAGVTDLACEVSAHAGALSRTAPVRFETITYTNLSRDHLDDFTPEEYLAAKLMIARDAAEVNPEVSGIGNARDQHTRAFLEPIDPSRRILFAAFAEGEDASDPPCDISALILKRSPRELQLELRGPDWVRHVALPLVGRFNAENAAAAAAIAHATGIEPDIIANGLSGAQPIPGRLERVDQGQAFLVIVDYAHAPQPALEALSGLREMTSGRLIGVMGAGGDRDRGKRPLIGEILASQCDIAVITSDNPRSEEPLDIINDILVGARRLGDRGAEVIVEPDRKKAIGAALERAQEGDTVAILGKGHETYQIFRDKTIHFDDREVVREWLGEHGWSGA